MLEKDVEERVCRYAKKLGIDAEKFTSPAKRSVPDRILTFPVKHGVAPTVFIEFKTPGKKATPKQKLDHEKRRKRGSIVYVIDNVELGKDVVTACFVIFGCADAVGHACLSGARGKART